MLLRLGAVVEIEVFEEGQRDSPGERRSRPATTVCRRAAALDVRALAGRADTTTRSPTHSLSRSGFLMAEAARQPGPALFPSGVVCNRFRIDGVLGVGGTGTVFRALAFMRPACLFHPMQKLILIRALAAMSATERPSAILGA